MHRVLQAGFPNFIWRETQAQHFDTPGGNYVKDHPSAFQPCQNKTVEHMAEHEFRNRAAANVLRNAGIPVLPVWQLTAASAAHHPGPLSQVNEAGDHVMDCTHFCQYAGSVLDAWITMLQNLLEALFDKCRDLEPFQECVKNRLPSDDLLHG